MFRRQHDYLPGDATPSPRRAVASPPRSPYFGDVTNIVLVLSRESGFVVPGPWLDPRSREEQGDRWVTMNLPAERFHRLKDRAPYHIFESQAPTGLPPNRDFVRADLYDWVSILFALILRREPTGLLCSSCWWSARSRFQTLTWKSKLWISFSSKPCWAGTTRNRMHCGWC